jgi:hypothetical protein
MLLVSLIVATLRVAGSYVMSLVRLMLGFQCGVVASRSLSFSIVRISRFDES